MRELELLREISHLENIIQAQASEVEALRARGPFSFFQKRRLNKMFQGEEMARRLREDELRIQITRLKRRVKELELKLEVVE